MKLIKIYSDRVQIKTDSEQLGRIKINNLLLLQDDLSAIVCIVTGITGNDSMDIYDLDGESLGQTQDTSTIDCGIIGSLVNGEFTKSIDVYPTAKVMISQISEKEFSEMLKQKSGFKIGKYANYDVDSYIDGNRFFQRHFSIVGNTGSGKSVTVSSLLEKLSMLKSSNVILFDLHGEYSGLSYVKNIKIGNDGMGFPFWFLPFKDFYSSILRLKEETSTAQLSSLRKAYYISRSSDKSEELPIYYTLEKTIEVLEHENTEMISTGEFYKTGDKAGTAKKVRGENNGRLSSVIALLQDKLIDKRYSFMCGKEPQEYLYHFISEIFSISDKNVKTIDLSDVPHDMVPTIIAVVSKLIYSVQLQQERENIHPLTLICEEAHVYIPSSDFGIGASQRRLLDIFETIAKEGRKFGVTLGIVSQRPSELNKTIMAQCANYIVLKMTNETDKGMLKSIMPDGSSSIIDMLSLFTPGDCFVIGDAANITFKTKIDLPSEMPNSNTIDVWDIWGREKEVNTDLLVSSLIE